MAIPIIRTRRLSATPAGWANTDPVIRHGEIAIEHDVGIPTRMKVGYANQRYSQLPYITAESLMPPPSWADITGKPSVFPPDPEMLDDRVAALLVPGANVGIVYNDLANTITISSSGGSGEGGGIPEAPNDGVLYGRQSLNWAPAASTTMLAAYLPLAGGTLTGQLNSTTTLTGASTPAINIQQTWNNAATTFVGHYHNVTDTASNASSLIAQWQVGAANRMYLTKTGNLAISGTFVAGSSSNIYWSARSIMSSPVDGQIRMINQAGTDFLRLSFGPTTTASPAIKKLIGPGIGIRDATDVADADITFKTQTWPNNTTLGATTAFVTAALSSFSGTFQPVDGDLTSIAAVSTTGLLTRIGTDSYTTRLIAGTTNRTTITAGDGVAANPVIDIAATYAGQNTITTLGTVVTGAWNASVVTGQYGGTGFANTGKTIILGGNLTTSGAFASTFTMTNTTSVTFPTSGTLATTANLASYLPLAGGTVTGNLTVNTIFTVASATGTSSVPLRLGTDNSSNIASTAWVRSLFATRGQGAAIYVYHTPGDTSVDPGAGLLTISDLVVVPADPNAKRIAISKTDADGVSRFLTLFLPGDSLIATNEFTPVASYARYDITGDPVDMGTWVQMNAVFVGRQGPFAVDGQRIKVTGYLNTATGDGPILGVAAGDGLLGGGVSGNVELDVNFAVVANLNSPIFTGDPQAPTPPTADSDTSIATTAFVKNQNYLTTATAGTTYQPLDSDLSAIAALTTTGIIIRTGTGTIATRSVTGVTNRITVLNGDGITTNASIDIAATYAGQTSITTLGTVGTGIWQGTLISGQYGGTGIANAGKTITLGGSLTTTGAFTSTFTMTGITTVTFPTTGTLATTAQLTAGTVTTLSVVSANGLAGSVANATTTPAITLSTTVSGMLKGDGTAISAAIAGTDYVTPAGLTAGLAGYQPLDADLTALAALSTLGMMARTAANTYVVRTITGTAARTTITAGDGIAGNPTIDIAATYVGQTSITTLGTVTAGTWTAGLIAGQYGGTGVANTGKTITIGGNLSTVGAFTAALTMTGNTTVTFPTTGTLATTANLASYLPLAGGTMTGNLTVGTAALFTISPTATPQLTTRSSVPLMLGTDNSSNIASTAWVRSLFATRGQGSAIYVFRTVTDTSVDPGTGNIAVSDLVVVPADPNAKRLAISKTDADSITRFLMLFLPGDSLIAVNEFAPTTQYARYDITGDPVDMGAWVQMNAVFVSRQGAFATDGQRIKITGYLNTATGDGPILGVAAGDGLLGGGVAGNVELDVNFAVVAALDSPVFFGNPTAPTPLTTDNDTTIATTAFVQAVMAAEVAVPAGAVAYGDTTGATGVTGVLADFSWDATNKRLGILTSAPTQSLDVRGTAVLSGQVQIGATTLTAGFSFNINKTMTGATTPYGIRSGGVTQSDATAGSVYFATSVGTVAATFTVGSIYHYYASQGTFGAGSTVTNQYGVFIANNLIGATNNYAFVGQIPDAANRWNLYMSGTAPNYFVGAIGQGSTALTAMNVRISRAMVGTTTYGVYNNALLQSDVLTGAYYNYTYIGTAAASFTVPVVFGYRVEQQALGAGSAITSQTAFHAGSTLISGTTGNYGFVGAIPAGTGRYNFYATGTAQNRFAGATTFDTTVGITGALTGSTADFTGAVTHATPAAGAVATESVTAAWVLAKGYGTSAATVTTVSVVSANGLAGTVANPTTTPAITLSTTITGMLKGNATAISAAVAGTDYMTPANVSGAYLPIANPAFTGTMTGPAITTTGIISGSGSQGAIRAVDATTSQTSIWLRQSGMATDKKTWELMAETTTGNFILRSVNDAYSASNNVFAITRGSTYTVSAMTVTPPLTLLGALTGPTATFSRADAAGNQLFLAGTTKGIRFNTSATTSSIEGVDQTGVGSYQPLTLNGSVVNVTTTLVASGQLRVGSSIVIADGSYLFTPYVGATDGGTVRGGIQLDGTNAAINFYTVNTYRGAMLNSGLFNWLGAATIANTLTSANDDTNSYGLMAGRWSSGYGRVAMNTRGNYGWGFQTNGTDAFWVDPGGYGRFGDTVQVGGMGATSTWGVSKLVTGGPSNAGYVGFWLPNTGARTGYIGFGTDRIQYVSESATGRHEFVGWVGLGSSPNSQLDIHYNFDQAVVQNITNDSTGSSSSSYLVMGSGGRTVHRYVSYASQHFREYGTGIITRWSDFDNTYFRANNGIELMQIIPAGVGIGSVVPASRFTVRGSTDTTGENIATFLANNLTQGVGIHYNGIRKVGSVANTSLDIDANGTGNINIAYGSTGAVLLGRSPSAASNDTNVATTAWVKAYTRASAFGALKTSNVTIAPSGLIDVQGYTKHYDAGNTLDAPNGVWTPQVAGAYLISGFANCAVDSGGTMRLELYRAGPSGTGGMLEADTMNTVGTSGTASFSFVAYCLIGDSFKLRVFNLNASSGGSVYGGVYTGFSAAYIGY